MGKVDPRRARLMPPQQSTNGLAVPEGEMFKSKSKPKTFKDQVVHVAHVAGDGVRQGSATAFEAAAPRLRDASAKLQDAAARVRPQVDRLNEQVRPRLEELGKQGRSQLDHLSSGGRAQFDSAKQRFDEQLRPEIAGRVGGAAAGAAGLLANAKTPKLVEELAVRATGDKKAMKKVRKALTQAGKDITKNTEKARQVKKHKDSGNGFSTTLIWILGIGGIAGIGYYVWKKAQPVEDPWSTPLPSNRPADARPVGSIPASRQEAVTPEVSAAPVPAAKADASAEASSDPDSGLTEEDDNPNAPRH